jgi:hypothetical protein
MSKHKRFWCIALTAVILMAASGCSDSSSSSDSFDEASTTVSETSTEDTSNVGNTVKLVNTTVSGEVSSVDGQVITMTVSAGGQGGGDMGSGDGQPPEMPSGDNSSTESGDSGSNDSTNGDTPPEKPDGESGDSSSANNGEEPPEKPDGENAGESSSESTENKSEEQTGEGDSSSTDSETSKEEGESSGSDSSSGNGEMKEMEISSYTLEVTVTDTSVLKDSDGNTLELSDVTEGKSISVTVDESGNVTEIVVSEKTEGVGGPGGQSSGVDSYTAVNEYSSDTTVEDETIESTGTDENAVLVDNGSSVTLKNITVNKESSDSTGGDNSSFYGVGASILTTDGTAYIDGANITSDAKGGAGIFSYGEGVIYVNNATISTKQDTSGGLHAAGGGTLYAWDSTAETNGESSAAIRSDRGGGKMVVDGGTYTSNGTGSPAVYSTADITVNGATLTANNSEAICIEGLNTIRLYDCDLSGNMPENEQNDVQWNVIVYQSMSGDSEVGNGTFQMSGGTLTAKSGGMFYTTNTESTFYLSGVDITYSDDNPFFLQATGNSNSRGWGTSGSNGADCTFTADNQECTGDIVYDSISNLDFYLENGSSLTGAVRDDETWAGNGGSGEAKLYIDSSSTWTVTGNSTLSSLYNEGTITDSDGKTVSIVGTDGTVYVQGDSEYTVTVGEYSTTADFSGASTAESFSSYEVENPFAS